MSSSDGGLDLALRFEDQALAAIQTDTLTHYVILVQGSRGPIRLEIDAKNASDRLAQMRELRIRPNRSRWAAYHADLKNGQPQICGNDEALKSQLRAEYSGK